MKLADVADINPRLAVRPTEVTPVSFLRMADVDAVSGTTSTGIERPFAEVAKGYTNFEDRDLLVAKITPCFENGKIAQARLAYRQGMGSTEFHVIRPRQEFLDTRYALHYLRTAPVRLAGKLRMTGSAGQRRVPEAFLADLDIPLPPVGEQRRIADILDRADALRAKRRETLTLLDDLTQSIFLDMFGDPILNPRGLPVENLGDLGTLDRGVSKHRPRNDPHLLGGAYPLIQTGDVAQSHGRIRTYRTTYSQLGLQQSRLWPEGTLCITIAANIARTGVLKFPACFPDSVVGFASDEATTLYVRTWFGFMQHALEASAPMSAQRNINLASLRSLPVPVPSASEMYDFSRRVKAVESLEDHIADGSDVLGDLFGSLQQRAFAGEL